MIDEFLEKLGVEQDDIVACQLLVETEDQRGWFMRNTNGSIGDYIEIVHALAMHCAQTFKDKNKLMGPLRDRLAQAIEDGINTVAFMGDDVKNYKLN